MPKHSRRLGLHWHNKWVNLTMSEPTLTLKDLASGRNNNFDFIRFVAASLVIFSHAYRLATGRGDIEPLVLFSGSQIWFGHLAVIIFFVISGFLIAQSYERSSNVIVYFWARALRIIPALVASIFLKFTTLSQLPLIPSGSP